MSVVDPRFTIDGISTIILVLGAWTVLWRDNPYYRMVSHWLIGAAIGNLTVVAIESIGNTGLTPIRGGQYLMIVPILLGFLIFARYSKKVSYLSRYSIAIMVGLSLGLMMRGWLDSMIVRNLATIATLIKPGQNPFVVVSYVLFIILFITSIYFFVFSLPLTRPKAVSYITKIGRWGLMAMLGVYFGSTVENRLEMTLPAMLFLLLGVRA